MVIPLLSNTLPPYFVVALYFIRRSCGFIEMSFCCSESQMCECAVTMFINLCIVWLNHFILNDLLVCVWQIYNHTSDFCHAALYVISGQRQRTRGHTQILQLVLLVHQFRGYPVSGWCCLHPAKYQLSHWLHHSNSVPRGVLPGLSTRPNCVHQQTCWRQRLHRYVQDPELCLLFSKTQGT